MSTTAGTSQPYENVLQNAEPTWNIIFIAVDINENYRDDKNSQSDEEIIKGIESFKTQLAATKYYDKVKLYMLQYLQKSVIGVAKKYEARNVDDKYNLVENQNPISFNCYDPQCYTSYIKSLAIRGGKTMVIFLAHSMGAGFLQRPIYKKKNSETDVCEITGYTYFSIKDLNTVFKNSFKNRQIDCLLALNCTLQSIETNCLFRDTVKYMIASQQILYPDYIFYRRLINDMANYSFSADKPDQLKHGYNDEHIFTKFILDCHAKYIKTKADSFAAYPFCLTLSKPANAKYFMYYLEFFSKSVGKLNAEYDKSNILKAKNYCIDPDRNDWVSYLDARSFFERLAALFTSRGNTVKADILERIISRMKHILLFHLADGNCAVPDDGFSENTSIHIPHGLALFLMRGKQQGATDVQTIYQSILDGETFLLNNMEWADIVTGELGPNWVDRWKLKKLATDTWVKSIRKSMEQNMENLEKWIERLLGIAAEK